MRIGVMGAGALGGYFGGRLAAAGHDVSLVARGAHLEALRSQGLRIESPKGDLHIPKIHATDTPADIGPVDVVMFMVKNADVERAAAAIGPMLARDTMVVTCQNGISAPERLAAVIGAWRVVAGVVLMPADIRAPGVVRHSAEIDRIIFGEIGGGRSERCDAFAGAFAGTGCMAEVSEEIEVMLWTKFVMQASFASVTALTRLDVGPLRSTPGTADLLQAAMEETAAVGRKVCPALPGDVVAERWRFMADVMPATVHSSMMDDLMRGKPIENEWLSGDVVRLGRTHGVPTPIHAVLHRLLQPFADGAPA